MAHVTHYCIYKLPATVIEYYNKRCENEMLCRLFMDRAFMLHMYGGPESSTHLRNLTQANETLEKNMAKTENASKYRKTLQKQKVLLKCTAKTENIT